MISPFYSHHFPSHSHRQLQEVLDKAAIHHLGWMMLRIDQVREHLYTVILYCYQILTQLAIYKQNLKEKLCCKLLIVSKVNFRTSATSCSYLEVTFNMLNDIIQKLGICVL